VKVATIPVGKLPHGVWTKDFEMTRDVAVTLSVLVMVAVIIGVDFAFFRNRFGARLMVNIGIVAVFVILYFAWIRYL
jgi:hypothetical protein